jgi:hypothetical protein
MKKTITPLVILGVMGLSMPPVSAASTGSGKDLSAAIGDCPSGMTSGFVMAPLLIGIASTAATNIAGVAVDAVAAYMTQVRAAKSTASLALNPQDESGLLNGSQCLYIFANTEKLKSFVKSENNGSMSAISAAMLGEIDSRSMTPFLAILSFSRANIAEANGLRYYKPNVLTWSYNSFLDGGCPLFRNCSRRDVAISLRLSRPIASSGSSPGSKAYPLSVGFVKAKSGEIGSILSNNANSLWFAYDTSAPAISNLEFSIEETSRPGALAEALASTATTSKQPIQSAVTSMLVPQTPVAQKSLVDRAIDEYASYANLHQSAFNLFSAGLDTPDKRNSYRLSRQKALTQMQIAKAAWGAAGIPNTFESLPSLPSP